MHVAAHDPTSDRTTGYHLFLEPTGLLRDELRRIIDALAEEQGSPRFAPHVTVLARVPAPSDEEAVARARRLASTLTPFPLSLGDLHAEPAYFRALHIDIDDSSGRAAALHQAAAAAFSMPEDAAYHPHLSLLYGNYPLGLLEERMRAVGYPRDGSFMADALQVYRTEGRVEQWEKLATLSLGAFE